MAIVNGVEVNEKGREIPSLFGEDNGHDCYDLGELWEDNDIGAGGKTMPMGTTGEVSAESSSVVTTNKEKKQDKKKGKLLIFVCIVLAISLLCTNMAKRIEKEVGTSNALVNRFETAVESRGLEGSAGYITADKDYIGISAIENEADCREFFEAILESLEVTYSDKDAFDAYMDETFDTLKRMDREGEVVTKGDDTTYTILNIKPEDLAKHGCECSKVSPNAAFKITGYPEGEGFSLDYYSAFI